MKMRKKKHLPRASKPESDLQKYFFRKITLEEIAQWEDEAFAKALEQATDCMRQINTYMKQKLEENK